MENTTFPLNTALGGLKISPLNAAVWKVTFHHSAQPYGEKPFPSQRKPSQFNSALFSTFNPLQPQEERPYSICIATFLRSTQQPSTIQHSLMENIHPSFNKASWKNDLSLKQTTLWRTLNMKSASFPPYLSLIHHSPHTYGE
jgi:hypothetical protein